MRFTLRGHTFKQGRGNVRCCIVYTIKRKAIRRLIYIIIASLTLYLYGSAAPETSLGFYSPLPFAKHNATAWYNKYRGQNLLRHKHGKWFFGSEIHTLLVSETASSTPLGVNWLVKKNDTFIRDTAIAVDILDMELSMKHMMTILKVLFYIQFRQGK